MIEVIDITPIVQAVLGLAATVITVVLVPYIKTKTTESQRQKIAVMVQTAVSAAEQIYKGEGRGLEKKGYVMNWLQQRGVTIDTDELDAMIESAVYDLPNILTAADLPVVKG